MTRFLCAKKQTSKSIQLRPERIQGHYRLPQHCRCWNWAYRCSKRHYRCPWPSRHFRCRRHFRCQTPSKLQIVGYPKALPVLVYRELHKIASESSLLIDSTIAWLLTLAYFWCMRSWEYSDVQGERRTKLLCVRNFCFFDQYNRDISSEYNHLHLATTVAITFEFQKKDVRYDTISHQRSGDSLGNCEMCPVRAAQELILQLQQYRIPPEKFADTPINYVE